MGKQYFRVTEDTFSYVGVIHTSFAEADTRVVVFKYYGLTDIVYANISGRISWLPSHMIRPETAEESLEELLLGEW